METLRSIGIKATQPDRTGGEIIVQLDGGGAAMHFHVGMTYRELALNLRRFAEVIEHGATARLYRPTQEGSKEDKC